jgi:hypothetical protein
MDHGPRTLGCGGTLLRPDHRQEVGRAGRDIYLRQQANEVLRGTGQPKAIAKMLADKGKLVVRRIRLIDTRSASITAPSISTPSG